MAKFNVLITQIKQIVLNYKTEIQNLSKKRNTTVSELIKKLEDRKISELKENLEK